MGNVSRIKRPVSNFNSSYWNDIGHIEVYTVNFPKTVNLKKKLKSTGDAIPAGCAVKDKIWGIGWSMNERRFDVSMEREKSPVIH